MITVKVIQIPGAIRDIALMPGATVADALRAASMSVDAGYELKVNGSVSETNDVLTDGDNITISTSAKGNV